MTSTIDTLTAEAAELRARIAAERRPGRKLGFRQSEFRGYGVAMGLPAIGSTIWRTDYDGIGHEVTVIATDGAYWSDATTGHSGRWITVEIPAEYVTRREAEWRMRLVEIQVDEIPDARREAGIEIGIGAVSPRRPWPRQA